MFRTLGTCGLSCLLWVGASGAYAQSLSLKEHVKSAATLVCKKVTSPVCLKEQKAEKKANPDTDESVTIVLETMEDCMGLMEMVIESTDAKAKVTTDWSKKCLASIQAVKSCQKVMKAFEGGKCASPETPKL